MTITSLKRQQGVAAIILVISLVPMFGLTFLALEGTRYVQKQARLNDALESTALALASANNPDFDPQDIEKLGQSFVDAYVRNQSSDVSLIVQREEGEEEETDELEGFAYVQYSVSAQTHHRSWFYSDFIPSFSQNLSLASNAAARNYLEEFEPLGVDIVFVADFSGSMRNNHYHPNSNVKYPLDYLKESVEAISEMVLQPNLNPQIGEDGEPIYNRIGFVPYNNRTQELVGSSISDRLCVSQMRYHDNIQPPGGLPYEQVDWSAWALMNFNNVERCAKGQSGCNMNALPADNRETSLTTVADVLSKKAWMVSLEPPAYVDIQGTINDMFVPKHLPTSGLTTYFDGASDKHKLFQDNYVHVCNAPFWTIDLTTVLEDVEPAWETMDIPIGRGSTSVYQGVVRGAQVLDQGRVQAAAEGRTEAYKKRQKMIIILTDGIETPWSGSEAVFGRLVDAGMCDDIRSHFMADDNPLYMGVIGIKFAASEDSGYETCVGKDNIQDVSDLDDLLDEIFRMIEKGTRRNGVSRIFKPA